MKKGLTSRYKVKSVKGIGQFLDDMLDDYLPLMSIKTTTWPGEGAKFDIILSAQKIDAPLTHSNFSKPAKFGSENWPLETKNSSSGAAERALPEGQFSAKKRPRYGSSSPC
jgi:hypothetical protein